MKRWFKRVGLGLVLLLVVLGAVYAASWGRGPTLAQQRALSLMSMAPPPPAGSNAFTDVWTLHLDVDAGERQRIAAADVARFNAQPRTTIEPPLMPGAAALDRDAFGQDLCVSRQAGCLAMVRTRTDAVERRLARDAGLRTRAQAALSQHTYLASPLALGEDMPFAMVPLSDGMRLVLTQAALDFVQGRTSEGLVTTCRLVAGWDRWEQHPDLLIDQMLGLAYLESAMRLQADMLAALPPQAPAPAECQYMRRLPDWQQAGVCRVAKREFQYMAAIDRHHSVGELLGKPDANLLQRAGQHLLYRREATRALLAERMAYACSASMASALVRDERITQPASALGSRLECVSNLLGCALSAQSAPLEIYQRRVQDYTARRRLMAVLWFLRDEAARPDAVPARLRQLPRYLHAGRSIQLADDSQLMIELFEPRDGEATWRLPLPGSAWGGKPN